MAVQLPQKDFIDRVVSSKMVVLCDMHTRAPHSEHLETACALQTEHLANQFTFVFRQMSAEGFAKLLRVFRSLWPGRSDTI